ncbi:MAG: hypothetical protein RJA13_1307 [Bacteroidota bacterium]
MKHFLKVSFIFLITFSSLTPIFAQHEQAFVIYNAKGKKVSYKKLQKAVLEKEFVFFGEHHDNPIAHWLEFEVLKALYTKHGLHLQVGFEMFEQDQQNVLNMYLEGKIDAKKFEDSCRLWPNYKTDYKPLLDFAKEKKINCTATNVPRKYASLLFKKGRTALDTISFAEKNYMAPLNFKVDSTLSQYAVLKEMEQHMGGKNMLEAQAFKDATMAHFILLNKKPGEIFYHINGAYHSDFYQGIIWYILQAKPESTFATISTVTQDSIYTLEKEHIGKADFIICVPESMTRTH